MYCRECGSTVNQHNNYCMSCGFRPNQSSNYCQSCGEETKAHQEMCVNCGEMLQSSGGEEYAGFWLRVAAVLIDCIILAVPAGILSITGFIVGLSLSPDSLYVDYNMEAEAEAEAEAKLMLVNFIVNLLSGLIGLFYFTIFHCSKWQATIGKKAVGIKVIDYNGGKISFWKSFGRYFGYLLSGIILGIGYIMAGLTKNKEALHDMMSSTLVIKKR
ncbi:RDD family protein [Salibacterium salarium]|uniref:RDD family protein n=1 Tax=Salibacterium salarium TaxID=284579 RepID=UPI0027D77B0F|nr:RDD family protein [Salibacterium salarium]